MKNQEYIALQERKRKYIPLACLGKCTISEASRKIGITARAVAYLKKRYRLRGDAVFINGHAGKAHQKKYSNSIREKICSIYRQYWQGSNFSAFQDRLAQYHGLKIGICTLKKILNANGITSPKERKPQIKQKHPPRRERACAGELLQLDASAHDWLMNGQKITLHGAIDDATHKITGLYFCKNECRLGYSEVFRQTLTRKGIPRAVYIDRHASFVRSSRRKGKTLEERLEYSKEEKTHWTEICKEMGVQIILALSAQAKGRVERLWQTLQGRLPALFRFLKIRTIEKANGFLSKYIALFNSRFSIPPRSKKSSFRKPNLSADKMENLLCVKFKKRTKADGSFIFHGFLFRLVSIRAACRDFTLCLSERHGIRAQMGGKFYAVKLLEPITDCIGDTMPQVEKDLIARYLLKDSRSQCFAL